MSVRRTLYYAGEVLCYTSSLQGTAVPSPEKDLGCSMAVRRVGLSLWFNGKGPHMLKNKKFSICWQSWVVLWPHSYRTQPKGGLRTRLWARLLLLWQLAVMLGKWNLKSCCWPYKNMVEVLCELHGCWPMVVSLYVVEFCCLKASIPVESVTSTTLTASDTFTSVWGLCVWFLTYSISEVTKKHMPVIC